MGDTIRFGLIGYGLWGRHHAAALTAASGAVVSAIACASEATAAGARKDYPAVPVHLGYRGLLERADIDAVAVAVPNHLHAEVGVAALKAGKDVLMEKPMATTVEGCDALIEAARAGGRVLTIGHELRLSSQYGGIKRCIDAGDIGAPHYAGFSLFRFPFRRGSQGWRYDAGRVGSWILEEPVHAFDLAMWYFERVGDPVSVQAFGGVGAGGAAMCKSFTAILRFPGDAHAASRRRWMASSITRPSAWSAPKVQSVRGGPGRWTAPCIRHSRSAYSGAAATMRRHYRLVRPANWWSFSHRRSRR